MDKTRLKSTALINPPTTNPETIVETSSTIKAFMTKLKRPRVKIVMGNVSIVKIGLITAFTIPKTTETITAVIKESTFTPGKRYAVIKIATPPSSKLINIPMWYIIPEVRPNGKSFWKTSCRQIY